MKDTIRIAALGDLHYGHTGQTGQTATKAMLDRLSERADVLVLCGDLTDQGTEEEARMLAKDLSPIGVPGPTCVSLSFSSCVSMSSPSLVGDYAFFDWSYQL